MNKKILISLSVIAFVAAIVIGGTTAYFSDTETSTGNVFTAGTLDLKVGSQCHYNEMECIDGAWVGQTGGYPEAGTACACSWLEKDLDGDLFFNFGDVKPGDEGENTISLTVYDNDAYLCAYVKNLVNRENGCNAPEFKAETALYGAGNETCGDPGIGEGEMQDNLYVTIWRDKDCDNVLDPQIPGYCAGTLAGTPCPPSLLKDNCELIAGCYWVPAVPAEEVLVNNLPIGTEDMVWDLGQFIAGQEDCLGFAWEIPSDVGNIIQGDSVTGDIEFYIEQVRNNTDSDFVCPVRQ